MVIGGAFYTGQVQATVFASLPLCHLKRVALQGNKLISRGIGKVGWVNHSMPYVGLHFRQLKRLLGHPITEQFSLAHHREHLIFLADARTIDAHDNTRRLLCGNGLCSRHFLVGECRTEEVRGVREVAPRVAHDVVCAHLLGEAETMGQASEFRAHHLRSATHDIAVIHHRCALKRHVIRTAPMLTVIRREHQRTVESVKHDAQLFSRLCAVRYFEGNFHNLGIQYFYNTRRQQSPLAAKILINNEHNKYFSDDKRGGRTFILQGFSGRSSHTGRATRIAHLPPSAIQPALIL